MAWQKANYLVAKMTKPRKPAARKPKPISPEIESLELDPDAWEKFERLVKAAARAGTRGEVHGSPRKTAKPK
jgi:hypothetical protein